MEYLIYVLIALGFFGKKLDVATPDWTDVLAALLWPMGIGVWLAKQAIKG